MARKTIKVALLAVLALAAPKLGWGQAAAIYVSQSGTGSAPGTAINPLPVSYITNVSNCGTGTNQIGAGTTIYLVGNFTYAAYTSAAIQLKCSGSSGNPITLTTYSGSRPVTISAPTFCCAANSPGGAISVKSLSYIVIDGGNGPCGTTTGGIDLTNPCGVVIENTSSGTAFNANTTHNDLPGGFVDLSSANFIETKNVALINSYVRLPPWQISSVSFSGSTGTVTCVSSCPVGSGKFIQIVGNSAVSYTTILTTTANNSGGSTFTVSGGPTSGSASGGYAQDVWGATNGQANFYSSAIGGAGEGNSFHDSIASDGGWLIQMQAVDSTHPIQIYNNQIYHMDHGSSGSPCYAGGCPAGAAIAGPIIHDNHFHDEYNWDDCIPSVAACTGSNGPGGEDNNHHDPIHYQIDATNPSNQDYFTNSLVYNNRFDGNHGQTSTTASLFMRASTIGSAFFNNIVLCNPGTSISGTVFADASEAGSFTTNPLVANNTIACTGIYGGGAAATGWNGTSSTHGTSGVQEFNNILMGQQFDWDVVWASGVTKWAAGGLDYNVYQDVYTDSGHTLGVEAFVYSGGSSTTLAGWQAALAASGFSPLGTGSPWPTGQGQDLHAVLGTSAQINLNLTTGQPNSGSDAIGAGLNLTSLCTGALVPLCTDAAGNARPASGAWTAGALQGTQSQVLPPLNLSLAAH